MATTSEILAKAIQLHQAGLLQAAEPLYRQILQFEPNDADALHLLGVIAHQVGNHAVAIQLIGRSIQLKGDSANVHNNLGGAYRALQMFQEAANCFRKALELQPDYTEAHFNLGHALTDIGQLDAAVTCYRRAVELKPNLARSHVALANALMSQKKTAEAIACYRHVLDMHPDDVETRINLGNALKNVGQIEDAINCYRKTIELKSDFGIAFLNLGVTLRDQGKLDEAIACYRRALELNPSFAEAHNNLGIALNDRDENDEAIACYRRALELKPDYADACNNLGNSLSDRGQVDEAIAYYRRALDRQPDFVEAHCNLGNALKMRGKLIEAEAWYRRALQLSPESAEAHNCLSALLKAMGKLDEAVASGRRALELKSNYADACNHLGNALKDQGKLVEALDCYRRAVELHPDDVHAHSNFVYTHLFCPGYDGRTLREIHNQWNARHAAPLSGLIQPAQNDRSVDRRLKIGYVSPDFRNHVVGRNLIPLFREHDHRQFEIICYADVLNPDDLTRRFQENADLFRNTSGLADSQLAQSIRDDRIDILVDLTLHMAQNRLLVFARKPAPVQLTFAGYPGTTGLTSIDYRLTDPYLDPPDLHTDCYSEESIHLRNSFWCYDPLESDQTVNPLPAIDNGYVTFGCLNNFCKVNPPVLKLWASVLNAVDRSRLIILSGEGSNRRETLLRLADDGIDAERVTFVSNQPRQQYLEVYHQIDIGLDTLPYNGHSTSLDSYWMGVPVVTLVGTTVVGRAGKSQLLNLGLPELIAESPESYVTIARGLAQDLPRLRVLRTTLRERMQSSPLMDALGFARSIETVYREVWQRWCDK